MMLTVKQPVHYGYRPVHDLPTPPTTSRATPPLTGLETGQKALPALPRRSSPPSAGMSGSHRGLPLPPAMTLAQPTSAPGPGHGSAAGPLLHAQAPPPPPPQSHSQMLGSLPGPPQWQGHGSEESMRTWLLAKTEEERSRQEEERRRQEEEKTRQETLRLEQRKLEYEILRTSLERGIPPAMVPVVFAGMAGGSISQVALEWAQQYLAPQPGHQPQLLPAGGQLSPDQRRDSTAQQYAPYPSSAGVPSTPGSAPGPGPGGFVPYQGPTSPARSRAHTLSSTGSISRPPLSSIPRVNTGDPSAGQAGPPLHPGHSFGQQAAASQQDSQSHGIYFHHWQPPASQTPSSQQPAAPSVDSPKKRKATGPPSAVPPPSAHSRYRSPPFGSSGGPSALSNPPTGRRRGHSRQRSDASGYRATGPGRSESFGLNRSGSPGPMTREATAMESASAQPRSGAHSVSSLLSDQASPQYGSDSKRERMEMDQRQSPPSSAEEKSRGAAAGSAYMRESEHDL